MFERYAPAITSFCRHMVGSREEAEEAVQHTFAAAYQSLRQDDRDMALKPWLYKIARNHCISILRERPDQVSVTPDAATASLAEHVEVRADLRAVLRDLSELPEEQREALLLTEISGLSHQEVARILGCPAQRVKGLVFRARRNLIEWRDARETPCDEIREQLVTLRGTELRRNELRHHLRVCPGCRGFLAEVREHRRLLALALPLAPTAGLKASVLGAVDLGGGGSAAGALSAIGTTAPVTGASVAKVTAVVIAIGGGAAITQTAVRDEDPPPRSSHSAVEAISRSDIGEAGDRFAGAPATPRPTDGFDDPPPGAPADRASDGRARGKTDDVASNGVGRRGSGASERSESDQAGNGPPVTHKPGKGPPATHKPGKGPTATHKPGKGPTATHKPGKGPTEVSGPKTKKGKRPSRAGNPTPAPAPKGGDRPGTPEDPKPDQGAPPGSGGPPTGGNAPGPKGPADEPKPPAQPPGPDSGGDEEGLGLDLPVPLLDLLGG